MLRTFTDVEKIQKFKAVNCDFGSAVRTDAISTAPQSLKSSSARPTNHDVNSTRQNERLG